MKPTKQLRDRPDYQLDSDDIDGAIRPQPAAAEEGYERNEGVVLEQVCFGYGADVPALFASLCMQVDAGEMAAIVGPPGCGKSTLVHMISGLYMPRSGRIRMVGGRRVGAGHGAGGGVAVIPREPMLFAGSLLDNLYMADPFADLATIGRACRLANVTMVPADIPECCHPDIGERGGYLLPGERRCIGIARALLKDPAVLILDDTFAGLRATCRRQLLDAVNGLKGQVTVIVTARRVPMGLDVDTVYRLGSSRNTRLTVIPGRSPPGIPVAGRRVE